MTGLRLLLGAALPLTPEEAYHWTYGAHLDWSYFDHPPVVAWSIRLGCEILGDTPLGVRLLPVLYCAGTALVLALLARELYGPEAALLAVLFFHLTPVPSLAGAGAFPDSPLLFFWSTALLLAWRAMHAPGLSAWAAAGACWGLAMISKYTGIFMGLSLLFFMLVQRDHRRHLARPGPYVAAATAFVVFLPVLVWNAGHEWASLRYQSAGRLSQGDGVSLLSALKFLAQQGAGSLGLLLPLGIVALVAGLRRRRPSDTYLLAGFLPIFGFFLAVSFTRSNHLMWPMPAFLSLVVLMAGVALDGSRTGDAYRRRAPWLAGISAGILVLAATHAFLPLPGLSPYQGLYGWSTVARRASELGRELDGTSFTLGLGRKYVVPSQLAFAMGDPHRVYGKELLGQHGLQFDLWADPASLAGRDAVVVLDATRDPQELEGLLRRHFERVEPRGAIEFEPGRRPLLTRGPTRFAFFIARSYRPAPRARWTGTEALSRAPGAGGRETRP